MTLWIDVTDLYHWGLGHLTGIQRTSASVLSELMAVRGDVQLFAYDPAAKVLRKIDAHALPAVVRRYIGARIEAGRVSGNLAEPAASAAIPSVSMRGGLARLKQYLRPRLWFLRPAVRRLRSGIQRQKGRWAGPEAVEIVKDFRRSTRRLLDLIWRNVLGRERSTASMVPAALGEVPPKTILFQPGDVCLSLSATWGFPHYGDVIAANSRASGAKCINMLYDLIPTLFPQWVLPGHSQMITLWVRQQIQNADVVLTISKFQKEEISKFIAADKLPVRPVEVIHLGDNPKFVTPATASASLPLPRYVPERKFVVCVATIDVRKNHSLLYQVWRRLTEELGPDCPQLVLVGTIHLHVSDFLHQIRNDRLVNRLIVHLHDVADEELAWYYRHCAFTIYPSIYEGWGLPISESLSLGRYCIAGNRTSLPEAGGDLVDYFDPLDFAGCYKLVFRAVTDPDYVRQCEERIRTNYVPHTWAMTAAHISEIVDRIGGLDRQAAVG